MAPWYELRKRLSERRATTRLETTTLWSKSSVSCSAIRRFFTTNTPAALSPIISLRREMGYGSRTASKRERRSSGSRRLSCSSTRPTAATTSSRSEEHTSELQSRRDLVCRLLLEKKKEINR